MSEKKEMINHPAHYQVGQYEAIKIIDALGLGFEFCLGNAIKYIMRCKSKGNMAQDLAKVEWYIHHINECLKDGTYTYAVPKGESEKEKTEDAVDANTLKRIMDKRMEARAKALDALSTANTPFKWEDGSDDRGKAAF